LLEPDLFVVALVAAKRTMDGEMPQRLLLTVEVLSPSTRRADRCGSARFYLDEAYPSTGSSTSMRLIERWRQGDARPEIVTEPLSWQPIPEPELALDLPRFFAGVLD
jgi:Uma2 family endonuclease